MTRVIWLVGVLAACGAPGAPEEPPGRSHRPAVARPAPAPLPAVTVAPIDGDPVTVRVEVMRTDAEQRRGMMGRRYLRRGRGMLFVYRDEARREFWMRNTFVSLDMIFIDASRRVVGVIERTPPLNDTLRAVDAESQYVLEVGAGFAAEHGVGVGATVSFENMAEERDDVGTR